MTNLTNRSTTDNVSIDPLTQRLMQVREKLMEANAPAIYLGDSGKILKDLVVWKRIGRGNQLVTKESATAVDRAEEAQAAADTTSGKSDVTLEVNRDAILEPALLSAIVFIDFDDCWLTPCGYWKGPNRVTKRFEDVKLSFQGKAPSRTFLSNDFSTAIENAKVLMNEIATGDAKTGFLVTPRNGGNAFRFRHAVFEELTFKDGDSDTASDSDDTWTMADWPVLHSEAEREREKMASTHRPVPLPAYNINGELIDPSNCKNALAGAIARVTFTMSHWLIETMPKNPSATTNSYVADIQSVRVLVSPASQATTSPKKRKTAQHDPGDGSPDFKRVNKV